MAPRRAIFKNKISLGAEAKLDLILTNPGDLTMIPLIINFSDSFLIISNIILEPPTLDFKLLP